MSGDVIDRLVGRALGTGLVVRPLVSPMLADAEPTWGESADDFFVEPASGTRDEPDESTNASVDSRRPSKVISTNRQGRKESRQVETLPFEETSEASNNTSTTRTTSDDLHDVANGRVLAGPVTSFGPAQVGESFEFDDLGDFTDTQTRPGSEGKPTTHSPASIPNPGGEALSPTSEPGAATPPGRTDASVLDAGPRGIAQPGGADHRGNRAAHVSPSWTSVDLDGRGLRPERGSDSGMSSAPRVGGDRVLESVVNQVDRPKGRSEEPAVVIDSVSPGDVVSDPPSVLGRAVLGIDGDGDGDGDRDGDRDGESVEVFEKLQRRSVHVASERGSDDVPYASTDREAVRAATSDQHVSADQTKPRSSDPQQRVAEGSKPAIDPTPLSPRDLSPRLDPRAVYVEIASEDGNPPARAGNGRALTRSPGDDLPADPYVFADVSRSAEGSVHSEPTSGSPEGPSAASTPWKTEATRRTREAPHRSEPNEPHPSPRSRLRSQGVARDGVLDPESESAASLAEVFDSVTIAKRPPSPPRKAADIMGSVSGRRSPAATPPATDAVTPTELADQRPKPQRTEAPGPSDAPPRLDARGLSGSVLGPNILNEEPADGQQRATNRPSVRPTPRAASTRLPAAGRTGHSDEWEAIGTEQAPTTRAVRGSGVDRTPRVIAGNPNTPSGESSQGAADRRDLPADASSQSLHVHIGRIEVRSPAPELPSSTQRAHRQIAPVTLDAYLARRRSR